MTDEQLAEALYLAYWAPTRALTGREIAPYAGHHDAEKSAWLSVARRARQAVAETGPA